jgi:hypothetical protein
MLLVDIYTVIEYKSLYIFEDYNRNILALLMRSDFSVCRIGLIIFLIRILPCWLFSMRLNGNIVKYFILFA